MTIMPGEAEPALVDVAGAVQRRPLTHDVLLTFGAKVAIVVLNVAATVIVARALGPAGRGAVAVAFSLTLLLIQFGSLGLQSANAYFAAREPAQISRILTNTLWAVVGVGLLLAIIALGIEAIFPAAVRGLDSLEIAVVAVGLPAALATQLFQSILLAEGRMVAYNGVELGMNVAMVVGLGVALLAFSGGVLAAIAVLVGTNVAGALVFLLMLRHHRPGFRKLDWALLRAMLHYGVRLYIAALLAYVVVRANLIFVNSYLGGVAAGEFSIAVAVGEGIRLLPAVVALNLFPRVARGDPSGDTAAVFRSLALVYGVLCAVTIPFAGPVIRLLYGRDFSEAATIYYWMLPGIFCFGMVSVLSYHFAGRGFPLEALMVWVVGVVINFAMVVPLLSGGASVNTAALAISIAYAVILLLHVRLFAKESGGYSSLIPRPRETVRLLGEMAAALGIRRVATAGPRN
jgi:O-antigen/teichoic acid export membrane protein